MRKEIKKILSFSPAWIEDVNYAVNPGYIKFKNGFINDLGKPQKRKGWKTVKAWTQPDKNPGSEGNLPLDYTRPLAGSDSCARTEFIHIKSKTQASGSVQKYCLVHRIINGQNALVKQTYDAAGIFVSETQIATPEQFKNYGPVKFIETNDQVYIINSFNKLSDENRKQGYMWKYAYGENLKQLETDRIHNVTVSAEMYCTAEIITTGAVGLVAGKYSYLVAPVYNTGTESRHNDAPFTYFSAAADIVGTNKSVIIKIFCPYDPYIIGYNVYRTKVNKSALDGFYKVTYVEKPVNSITPGVLQELPNPTSPIFVIGGVQRRVTDMNTADSALGSKYITVPFLNTNVAAINWFNNPGTRGQNPPAEIYNNSLDFPVSCGIFADNRMILAYGNRIYFSLVDKTDAIDGTLTLLMPLAHETENPAVEVAQVGPWTFVWCKSGAIYKLMPSTSAAVPYQLTLVSNSHGVDNLNGVVVLDNIAYFMFGKRLYAMNAYGQIKPIDGPVSSVFKTAIDDICLTKNDKERFIKIMFRTADGSREVEFWPEKNMWVDIAGYRDIFNPTGNGNEVGLLSKNERLRLMAYEYNNATGEEWAVTFDGDIVVRDTDYADKTQASAVTVWQDYVLEGPSAPVNNYNVDFEFQKSFTFSERVYFPSAVFSGTGKIWVSYSLDDSGVFSEEKLIDLDKAGVETIVDYQGFTCILKVRHDSNENIDLDYFGLKVASEGKVDYMNKTDNGEV